MSESDMSDSGVLISSISPSQNTKPRIISAPHKKAEAMSVVYTAVFMSDSFFAPKRRDTTTEHPTLHPNANAMKIKVIS